MRLRKGEATRAAILEAALGIARREGLEGLTIGVLAEQAGMSKSGAFAHFGSRTDLQIAALDESARRFTEAVFLPALLLVGTLAVTACNDDGRTLRPARPDQPAHHGIVIAHTSVFDPSKNV